MEKAKSIYQDSTIHKLQYITNIEIINHINTSKERAKFINSIDTEYKILSNNNYAVFFYGKKTKKNSFPSSFLHNFFTISS